VPKWNLPFTVKKNKDPKLEKAFFAVYSFMPNGISFFQLSFTA